MKRHRLGGEQEGAQSADGHRGCMILAFKATVRYLNLRALGSHWMLSMSGTRSTVVRVRRLSSWQEILMPWAKEDDGK